MKRLPYVLCILALAAGAALLSFPTFSNSLHSRQQQRLMQDYLASVDELPTADYTEMYDAARQYNDLLTGIGIKDPFLPNSGFVLPQEYESILNLGGVMGSVEIPSIGVHLSIRHGTSDEVLKIGVGHLTATALPVGGETTHCVLTAHSGQAQAKLFTDLEQMELGNIFYLHVLDKVLAYEVDQILVVRPDETDVLRPVPGQDLATLVTCTPYAINSHRLFVRGHRVENVEEEWVGTRKDAYFSSFYMPWQYLVSGGTLMVCALLLVGSLIQNKTKTRATRQGKTGNMK